MNGRGFSIFDSIREMRSQNFKMTDLPCSLLSDGVENADTTTDPFIFAFVLLRVSVAPWCKGLVFPAVDPGTPPGIASQSRNAYHQFQSGHGYVHVLLSLYIRAAGIEQSFLI